MRLLTTALVLIAGMAIAGTASAQEKFKAVTTFTVIADIAQNVAGDAAIVESITKPNAEIHNYQPTPGDILRAQDANLILWNGLNLELWFEQFFHNLSDVPSVVVSEGVEPMGIAEGPYTGKPNPHAWMSPRSGADLCREHPQGLRRARSGECRDLQRATPPPIRRRSRPTVEPIRQALAAIPEERRWLVSSEGAFSYLARDFGLKELYLWPINADQQGTPQQVRKVIDAVQGQQHPGGVQRKHRVARPGQAGRARDRREIWRRALCRFAQRRRRPGADLSRPAAGHRRNHRQGPAGMNAPFDKPEHAAPGDGLRRRACDRHLPQRPHRAAGRLLRHPARHASRRLSASTAPASRRCSRRSWASCRWRPAR